MRVMVLLVLVVVGCASGGTGRLELVAVAPPDSIEASLFLIGDGGDPAEEAPVMTALSDALEPVPDRSLVVFLGDNIYPRGLPDTTDRLHHEYRRRLDVQVVAVAESGVRGVVIPGNHDWDSGGPDGWRSVLRAEARVREVGRGLVTQLPEGGCPGPRSVDLGETFRIVVLDTQWWFHKHEKPGREDGCRVGSRIEVLDSLSTVLERSRDRVVVVAAHHPLASGGPHGGYFDWKQHLFPLTEIKSWLWIPLPLVGSIYPATRALGVLEQDLSSSSYESVREPIDSVLALYRPLAYAAGHEHNLQILRGKGARFNIVSGAGYYRSRPSAVHSRDDTIYAVRASGWVRLDLLREGRIRLSVVTVDENGASQERYSDWVSP